MFEEKNIFMIMCHKNIEQVIRLVKTIVTDNTDVIIHVDSNVSDKDFLKLKDFIIKERRVYLTDNRLHGELDKRSLVDIVLEMIYEAKKIERTEKIVYKYWALLSGQDYLIKPMKYIENNFKNLYPKPLIDCTPYSKKNWIYHKFNTNKVILKYNNWISSKLSKGLIRSGFRLSSIFLQKIIVIIGFSSYKKLKKNNINIYGGSAWWILPDKIIDFILKEIKRKEKYIDILLNDSFTPEETFFQIMAMKSPLNEMIEINPVDMVKQNCKTWAYFSDVDKPFKGHPYIFTIDEYEKIKISKFWIARKFDENIDNKVLDMIDKNILEIK